MGETLTQKRLINAVNHWANIDHYFCERYSLKSQTDKACHSGDRCKGCAGAQFIPKTDKRISAIRKIQAVKKLKLTPVPKKRGRPKKENTDPTGGHFEAAQETEEQKENSREAVETIGKAMYPGEMRIYLDFTEYPELMEKLKRMAKEEFRCSSQQIMAILDRVLEKEG